MLPRNEKPPAPFDDRDDEGEHEEEIDLPLAEELGGDDEPERDEGYEDLLAALDDGEGEDPLDDADASDLETGVDVDAIEDEAAAADDREVDVGPLDEGVSFDDGAAGEDHVEGAANDQDELDLDDPASDDDGGAEGTSEAPEDEVDEAALPELDADDEGEEGEEELAEALLAGAAEATIPWDASRWAPLEGAGAAEGEALLCSSSPQELAHLRVEGALAMTTSAGVIVVLSRGSDGPALERRRGDDEGWQRVLLRGAARRLAQRPRVKLAAAAGGRLIALTDGARVAVSRDGGQSFDTGDLGPLLAIAFAGDGDDAPLLALSAPRSGAPASLIFLPVRGEPTRVAALPEVSAGPAAMAWDASRECVWIACAAGLLALGSARRH